MKFNTLNSIPYSRSFIDTFGGYNHNLRIGDAEFYDMKNMTSDNYPLLSTRARRGTYALSTYAQENHNINGMLAKDVLCYVDGTTLYVNNIPVSGLTLTDSPKQLVSMGAKIVVFPDKVYVNTARTSEDSTEFEYGTLENKRTASSIVTYSACNLDGTNITISKADTEAPENPANMEYWIDTSGTKAVLKQYSSTSSMWVDVVTPYIKIKCSNIGLGFAEGDAVTITNITPDVEGLKDLNNQTSIVWKREDDYIVVIGVMDSDTSVNQECSGTVSENLTVSRDVPELDFVCESNNRIWGCKYGIVNGTFLNEIYACKQGDPTNWSVYAGISTDSYRASVGTDGQWTGCINYLGQPLFFKEDYVHTVYGNYPANYQITQTQIRGIQKGCEKSLAVVDEKLFYKSRAGIMVFTGSLPTSINYPLGNISYSNAVGCSLGSKYYVSMMDASDEWHLFVYDVGKSQWHKEDNSHAKSMAVCNETLYMATAENKIIELVTASPTEGAFDWYCETGTIGLSSPDKKYIARMDIRMSIAFGSTVRVSVQYDNDKTWEQIAHLTGSMIESFSIPIKPKRCDHMRIRIEGKGDAKIYSICKSMKEGSNV